MSKTYVPYWQKLLDGRWQMKRLEIFQRDNFTCRKCGESAEGGATLHVHHFLYRKGAEPWDYPNHELWTMCAQCHEKEEEERAALLSLMSLLPADSAYYLHKSITTLRDQDIGLWPWFVATKHSDLLRESWRREFPRPVEDYSI